MSALTELPKGSLRRAGPPALIAAALLFGVLSVGYAWIVARHLRNDARETSRLLGHVFAGLNDPREGAAADALLALADEVRHLGIPIAVTDTAGRITALDNAPFGADASEATRRNWIVELDRIHPPLIQPGVGTIHYGALPAARAFTGLAVLQGAMFLCLVILAVWAMRERVSAARGLLWVAIASQLPYPPGS